MKKFVVVFVVFMLLGCSSGSNLSDTIKVDEYTLKYDGSLFKDKSDKESSSQRIELANKNAEFSASTMNKNSNFFKDASEDLTVEEVIKKMLGLYTEFDDSKDTFEKSKIDGYDAYSFESIADYATIIVTDDFYIVTFINTDLDELPKTETSSLKDTIQSIKINK